MAPRRSASELAASIDHTNLKPEATRQDIVQLCEEALTVRCATVCVPSIWVSLAHSILRGTSVKVCSVAGFPSGAVPPTVKRMEAEIAMRNGAEEIDMVLSIGLLRCGELDLVRQDIATVAESTRERGALLKVILEAAALSEREIAIGCALSRLGGAQFVKTSTGLHPAGGARVEHVSWMRKAVGGDLGVKAAGGIRGAEDAFAMLAAGANRIGTSATVSILSSLESTTGG
ncbi:MAG: deoxyribose-phosphate aldolase [Bryobacterales bacterium]|nr:deoxyribose-phosphate aldolase [Bryobacterales bacterium]